MMQTSQNLSHPMATIKARLNETIATINDLGQDVGNMDDQRIRDLFNTTREVLKDLVTAYDLYEKRSQRLS